MTAFVIYALATWRVASLITSENGPFNVFARIRQAVGANDPGEIAGLRELFTCVWCMSVWVAAFWYLAARFVPVVAVPAALISAASAAAIAFEKLFGKD